MLRPWKFSLSDGIDPGLDTPVYLQVVHAIIQDIRRGRLLPGSALPSSRAMADALGVNRKTVVLAYDDLVAQGWLAAHGTRGTFVSERLPEPVSRATRDANSERANASCAPDYPFRASPKPTIVYPEKPYLTFDDGAPDHRLLPANALAHAYRTAVQRAARAGSMGYGDPMGSLDLGDR